MWFALSDAPRLQPGGLAVRERSAPLASHIAITRRAWGPDGGDVVVARAGDEAGDVHGRDIPARDALVDLSNRHTRAALIERCKQALYNESSPEMADRAQALIEAAIAAPSRSPEAAEHLRDALLTLFGEGRTTTAILEQG